MTVLWGLIPNGPGRWRGGWLYNPDDGRTYNVSASRKSTDLLIARIFLGVPLLGSTKTLVRMLEGNSEGSC
jgi:uncharacterized protein (DUF2147 family)